MPVPPATVTFSCEVSPELIVEGVAVAVADRGIAAFSLTTIVVNFVAASVMANAP